MYLKILINFILIVFLVSLQGAFIPALPSYFSNINILLVFLVFTLIVNGIDRALFYAFFAGIIMDIFSFMPFGTYSFSFIFSILAANFLQINFFTNRSLYSFLALTASATILSFLFSVIFNLLVSLFFTENYLSLNNELYLSAVYQLFINTILMVFVYYLTSYLSKSFRPVFLSKGKK